MASLGTDYESGSRRHRASVLELDAEVSVLGVVRDDRSFGRAGTVPCLITRRRPDERVRSSHRGEAALFVFATAFPFLGGAGATALMVQPADVGAWLPVLAGGLALLLPVWWLLCHNRLIRLRQQVRTACRQIDVDLGVRAGLVPHLVEVVRAASVHEGSLLESLARIRSEGDRDDRVAHESENRAAAREVLVLHERYPDLKTDALYRDLHERLWAIEEKLAHTRTFYNGVVTEWNDRIASFPALLVARACGYAGAQLFAGGDDELPPRLP
jgi:LemA protein